MMLRVEECLTIKRQSLATGVRAWTKPNVPKSGRIRREGKKEPEEDVDISILAQV